MLQPRPSLIQSGRSIEHACVLMARESVTPNDAGCQTYLIHRLTKLGFVCEQVCVEGVSNLIARWGNGPRNLAFCGHTDVVPPGDLSRWLTDPFTPVINDNILYGRGAADMKTGVAAMLAATERALSAADPSKVTYWWLITSDEEGEAEHGSRWMCEYLKGQGIALDMCIVGEPTAARRTGDTIKVGRRGSLSASIDVLGKQGHVAYPHSCRNAIHIAADIIAALNNGPWDEGSEDFPGTTLQVTHMDTGAFTDNLVPGKCVIQFNVRYSHHFSESSLKKCLHELVAQVEPTAKLAWSRPCEPYLSQPHSSDTKQPCLIASLERAIFQSTGRYPALSTSGGTSDGRFFASESTQVVELGVPNATIHQVNESVHLSDLLTLEDIYTDALDILLR